MKRITKKLSKKKGPPTREVRAKARVRASTGKGLMSVQVGDEALASAVRPQDAMTFEVQWAPEGGSAELSSLKDNERPVTGGPWTGTGRITVDYQAPRAALHVIEWRLSLPGKTLTSLRAFGKKAPSASRLLDEIDTKKTLWSSRGDVV